MIPLAIVGSGSGRPWASFRGMGQGMGHGTDFARGSGRGRGRQEKRRSSTFVFIYFGSLQYRRISLVMPGFSSNCHSSAPAFRVWTFSCLCMASAKFKFVLALNFGGLFSGLGFKIKTRCAERVKDSAKEELVNRVCARVRKRKEMSQKARAEGAPPPSPECIALAKFLRYNAELKNRVGVVNGKRVEFFKGTLNQ